MRFQVAASYRSLAAALTIATAIVCGSGNVGCASAPAATQPADAALNDPMNYTPSMPNTDSNFSGGDSKTIGKDINDLLNP
jgi:hypothetical protein